MPSESHHLRNSHESIGSGHTVGAHPPIMNNYDRKGECERVINSENVQTVCGENGDTGPALFDTTRKIFKEGSTSPKQIIKDAILL